MKNLKVIAVCFFLSVIMLGCSNSEVSKNEEKEIVAFEIKKEILQDTKVVYDTLSDAMNRTVQYGTTSDFGVLSTEEYDEKIAFYTNEEHYFGYTMHKDEYSADEYELIDLTSNASMNYLEYVKSELIDDEAAKEQVVKTFNRNMDSINKILNNAR